MVCYSILIESQNKHVATVSVNFTVEQLYLVLNFFWGGGGRHPGVECV